LPKVRYENPPGAAAAQGLYSHVGNATGGRLVFIAGQLSVNTCSINPIGVLANGVV